MKGIFKTKGVCAAYIGIELNGDVIEHVEFMGGCHGNLQAVAKLVEGMTVEEAAGRLEGIDCGGRGTSCPDQLSKALREALKQEMTGDGE